MSIPLNPQCSTTSLLSNVQSVAKIILEALLPWAMDPAFSSSASSSCNVASLDIPQECFHILSWILGIEQANSRAARALFHPSHKDAKASPDEGEASTMTLWREECMRQQPVVLLGLCLSLQSVYVRIQDDWLVQQIFRLPELQNVDPCGCHDMVQNLLRETMATTMCDSNSAAATDSMMVSKLLLRLFNATQRLQQKEKQDTRKPTPHYSELESTREGPKDPVPADDRRSKITRTIARTMSEIDVELSPTIEQQTHIPAACPMTTSAITASSPNHPHHFCRPIPTSGMVAVSAEPGGVIETVLSMMMMSSSDNNGWSWTQVLTALHWEENLRHATKTNALAENTSKVACSLPPAANDDTSRAATSGALCDSLPSLQDNKFEVPDESPTTVSTSTNIAIFDRNSESPISATATGEVRPAATPTETTKEMVPSTYAILLASKSTANPPCLSKEERGEEVALHDRESSPRLVAPSPETVKENDYGSIGALSTLNANCVTNTATTTMTTTVDPDETPTPIIHHSPTVTRKRSHDTMSSAQTLMASSCKETCPKRVSMS